MPKIEYEHYGVCHIKNTAFQQNGSEPSKIDPAYVGDFIEPDKAFLCCFVLRTTNGARGAKTPPRRCRGRRKLWNSKRPERAWMCCNSHSGLEKAAREWAAERLVRGV